MNRVKKSVKTRYPAVPDLLLSYVYFLNEYKTSSIIIGYDSEIFEPKMILLKDKEYQFISWNDWHYFYNCIGTIRQYFDDDEEEEDANEVESTKYLMMVNEKNQRFNLSLYKQEKHLIFIEENKNKKRGTSKIRLNGRRGGGGEWERLSSLAPLLHSIFSWYMLTGSEINSYYTLYLNKCILQNCARLDYKDFFTPMHVNNKYCNYSRLFNELPILSKNKLISDLYYALLSNTTADDTLQK